MSARCLQRVVVRMLFDPDFTSAVYADPQRALEDEELSVEERSWLVRPDPRRWTADAHRQARALHGLLEEYPVSAALYCRTQRLDQWFSFFSSSDFHQCIMTDGSLASTFGRWVAEYSARISPIATLERLICERRRAALRPSPTGARWHVSPHVEAEFFPVGTLAYYQNALAVLQSMHDELVEHCLNGTASLIDAYRPGDAREGLIIDLVDGGGVGDASSELVELLIRLRSGLNDEETMAILGNMGVLEPDARELLQSLVEEGLLLDTMN